MTQSAAALIQVIHQNRLRVFSTSDFLTLTGLNGSAGVKALDRLSREKVVVRLKRGVWINKLISDINPYEAVPFLVSPWAGYVSLYSALADYGLIAEIPAVVYAVSSGRPFRLGTERGSFHVHHLPARLMWGYAIKQIGNASFPMAEPEKAFLDQAYLALVPRSPVRLPFKRARRWKLDPKRLQAYARKFEHPPLLDYITSIKNTL